MTFAYQLAVSTDGRSLATGMRNGAVCVWDLQTVQLRWQSKGGPHTGHVKALEFARDGHSLVSFADDGSIVTSDAESGAVLSDAVVEPSYCAACAPDTGVVVRRGKKNQVRVWDLQTGQSRGDLLGPPRGPSPLAVSPDGRLIAASGCLSREILLWDRQTGAEVRRLQTTDTCTKSLAFSDDSGLLASADPFALAESGALAALGEGWVRAARRPDADPHYQHVTTFGERVYFGVAVVFPPRGRFIPSLLPFLARPDRDNVQGVLSMTRECTDLRFHHGETLGGHGIVPINDGRTLAINVLRKWMGGWVDHWAFVGEGADAIPEGYGPLPRASLAARSNVFVGDFARPD